jgi:hypothetical protein
MSATNKLPIYKALGGRTQPELIDLPVQAGTTQAIKQGEVCMWRNKTDFSTYPIIPASSGKDDFTPVIAMEEQASGDAAQLRRFMIATPDFAFEFDLDSATTIKPGENVSISDSQTMKKEDLNPVGIIWQDDLLTSAGAGTSKSKAFIRFSDSLFAGATGGMQVHTQESGVLDHADFTDGESTAGSIATGIAIQAGAIVLGYALEVSEAFAGDTTGTAELGDGTDADRFNGLPDNPSVYAEATVQSMFPAAGGYVPTAADLTLTITGTADWGNVSAGKVNVKVFYVLP